MQQPEPMTIHDLDPRKLSVASHGALKDGGVKYFNIEYTNDNGLVVRPGLVMPELPIAWPPRDFNNDGKFKMDMDLGDDPFYDQLRNIESKLANYMSEHSAEYFGKPLTLAVVETVMNPMAKRKDSRYPPKFKFSLPMKDGKCTAKVKGPLDQLMDPLDMVKNGTLQAIVMLKGIYVQGTSFGIMLELVLGRYTPPQAKLPEPSFDDLPVLRDLKMPMSMAARK